MHGHRTGSERRQMSKGIFAARVVEEERFIDERESSLHIRGAAREAGA